MKIAYIGTDFVILNEKNINDYMHLDKIHLIKLNFENPNEELIKEVLEKYPNTNRFVIDNNIKFYNDILKNTSKKYYVENTDSNKIITFFRKNNKVLFNFTKVEQNVKNFLLDNLLFDIIKNSEVIWLDKISLKNKENLLKNWNGNVISEK